MFSETSELRFLRPLQTLAEDDSRIRLLPRLTVPLSLKNVRRLSFLTRPTAVAEDWDSLPNPRFQPRRRSLLLDFKWKCYVPDEERKEELKFRAVLRPRIVKLLRPGAFDGYSTIVVRDQSYKSPNRGQKRIHRADLVVSSLATFPQTTSLPSPYNPTLPSCGSPSPFQSSLTLLIVRLSIISPTSPPSSRTNKPVATSFKRWFASSDCGSPRAPIGLLRSFIKCARLPGWSFWSKRACA